VLVMRLVQKEHTRSSPTADMLQSILLLFGTSPNSHSAHSLCMKMYSRYMIENICLSYHTLRKFLIHAPRPLFYLFFYTPKHRAQRQHTRLRNLVLPELPYACP
jgi:hypothetical protein